jgi:GAF domain-containing protein
MSDTDSKVAELEERLEKEVGRFRQLIEVATTLNSMVNPDELLAKIMASATDLVDAESSSLLLADEKTEDLRFAVVDGDVASLADQVVPAGQGVAGWALENREPVVVDDPAKDERFYQGVDTTSGFVTRNLMAIPLLVKDRPVGALEMINKVGGGSFTPLDIEVGTALASLAAVALDNAAMYTRLTEAVITARLSYRL